VTGCTVGDRRLLRIQDPFKKLERVADRLTVVKGFMLPAAAVVAAAEGER